MKKIKLIVFILLLTVVIIPQKLKAPSLTVQENKRNTENYIEFQTAYNTHVHKVNEIYRFLKDIGHRESSNNWKAYNRFGYIGEYQFGRAALADMGYSYITFGGFINNPDIFPANKQKLVMLKYMHKNNNIYFNNKIDSILKNNKNVRGVELTLSGLLAGAHLGGARGVTNLVIYNRDKADAFGTRISDYVSEFSGYDFDNQTITFMIDSLEKVIYSNKI